jgi:hypothetical protein
MLAIGGKNEKLSLEQNQRSLEVTTRADSYG